MVRNPEQLEARPHGLASQDVPDLALNLRWVEELRRPAVELGLWPPKDPLEGLEVDTRVARALNVQREP